jgi:hemerythrin
MLLEPPVNGYAGEAAQKTGGIIPMPFTKWGDQFAIGIAELDDDHKRLLALLSDLKKAVDAGDAREALGRVLAGLKLYISVHFAREEDLFLRTDYPDYETHRRDHEAFAAQVEEIHRDFQNRASDALPAQVLEFLRNWLYEHSLDADRAFAEYLKTNTGLLERLAHATDASAAQ